MALTPLRPTPRAKRPSQGKVLYVEDEDLNWEVTQHALRDHYTLTRAKTSREALDALDSERFDVILMDIQLSGSELNGIEITKIVKKQHPDIPVLFVTAYGARYDKAELVAAGGADLIQKPVNLSGLALAMTRVILKGIADKRPPKGE